MNIQQAVKESIKTKKMIARKYGQVEVKFFPTESDTIASYIENKHLIARAWMPRKEDLINDDWYLTNVNYDKDTFTIISGQKVIL